MKYFFVTGEASGDLHASFLFKYIKKIDQNAQGFGWGGNLMKNEGIHLINHYDNYSTIGFASLLLSFPKFLFLINKCKKNIKQIMPDVVIFIDFPGFNLRLLKKIASLPIKKIYYIPPQVWAWHTSRINLLKKYCDIVISILPFEAKFLKEHGLRNVLFYGNPIPNIMENHLKNIDSPSNIKKQLKISEEKHIIAIFPGSRKSEIKYIFPTLLKVIKRLPSFEFVIASTPYTLPIIKKFLSENNSYLNVKLLDNYATLTIADFGIIKSGTSTLEAAIMNIPQVVVYKGNYISYIIARMVAKVKYISLVNLIANDKVVPELIQSECNPHRIIHELFHIMENKEELQRIRQKYKEIKDAIYDPNCPLKIAYAICESISK